MTKAEAKRRICKAAADILDNGSNEFLYDHSVPEADRERLLEAFHELVAELRRRGGGRE